MREHQAEGGQWNAPCLGRHDSPALWPCESMQKLDDFRAHAD